MDIDSVLEKWSEAKEKIDILEAKIKKYKSTVNSEMQKKGVDKISAGRYTVTRRRHTRTSISKENMPEQIWSQYATRCSYDVFSLVKKT
jgi:hypothetical protein